MTPSKEISKIALSVSDNYGAPQASAKSSACIQLSFWSLSFCRGSKVPCRGRGFHVEGRG